MLTVRRLNRKAKSFSIEKTYGKLVSIMSARMKYCSKCGRPLEASISFCPYCDPTLYQMEREKRGYVGKQRDIAQEPYYEPIEYQKDYYPQQYYPQQQPKKGHTVAIVIGVVVFIFISFGLVGLFAIFI